MSSDWSRAEMQKAKNKKPKWWRPGIARRTYDFKEKTLARLDRAAATMDMTRIELLELIINQYCMTEKERQRAEEERQEMEKKRQEAKNEYGF
jgi:hypothetical protein